MVSETRIRQAIKNHNSPALLESFLKATHPVMHIRLPKEYYEMVREFYDTALVAMPGKSNSTLLNSTTKAREPVKFQAIPNQELFNDFMAVLHESDPDTKVSKTWFFSASVLSLYSVLH